MYWYFITGSVPADGFMLTYQLNYNLNKNDEIAKEQIIRTINKVLSTLSCLEDNTCEITVDVLPPITDSDLTIISTQFLITIKSGRESAFANPKSDSLMLKLKLKYAFSLCFLIQIRYTLKVWQIQPRYPILSYGLPLLMERRTQCLVIPSIHKTNAEPEWPP